MTWAPSLEWHAPVLFVRTVLVRDWQFLAVTLVSCSVAAIVATFQYSVFMSFLAAGSVMPRGVNADFWIKGQSVECFDFPDPINEDYAAALARYVPDARFRRVVFGFVPWRSPSGRRSNIALVGLDGEPVPQTGFTADRSDFARLDIPNSPDGLIEATIAGQSFHLARTVHELPTFLGAPYVIVSFDEGRRLLRMDPSSTSFLIGNFGTTGPADFAAVRAEATRRYPDVELVLAADFEFSSSLFWVTKTGAGAAILLAAVLAALLMMVLLVNGISRFIQRYHQDLLSLIGHGGSEQDIARIVKLVSALITATTLVVVLLVTPLVGFLIKPLLQWVSFRPSHMLLPFIVCMIGFGVSVLSSRRAVAAFGPEAVFRT